MEQINGKVSAMIDLHCHILHDMDDGPSQPEESLELCRIACAGNITQLVATPHIMDFSQASDFLSRRDRKVEQLNETVRLHGMELTVCPGAEVFVSDEIFFTDCLNRLTINQSRYILIEFPYSGLNDKTLTRYLAEIARNGLIPIIAHPERYVYFQREYELIDCLAGQGALYQVNADSLCGKGRRAEYRLALRMLERQAASFLATDAHSLRGRPGNLLDMLRCLPAHISSGYLDRLVNLNPGLVLRNRDLPAYAPGMDETTVASGSGQRQ